MQARRLIVLATLEVCRSLFKMQGRKCPFHIGSKLSKLDISYSCKFVVPNTKEGVVAEDRLLFFKGSSQMHLVSRVNVEGGSNCLVRLEHKDNVHHLSRNVVLNVLYQGPVHL